MFCPECSYKELIETNSPMVEEFKAIRKKYGWTQVEFEKILGVSSPTVSRWESNAVIQTKVADNLMRAIRQNEGFAEELAQRAGVKIPEPALV